MSVTRTLKFQVYFPSMRKTDLYALYKELDQVQRDLCLAANRCISALFQVRLGQLELPEGKGWSVQNLPYKALTGHWKPFGDLEIYRPDPSVRGLSGACKRNFSSMVGQKLSQKDFDQVLRGLKSLPTFKNIPLGFDAKDVKLSPEGHFSLPIWGGRRNNRVTVASATPTRPELSK